MPEERGTKFEAERKEEPGKDDEVFYNKEMLTNRDISQIAVETFREITGKESLRVLDATAGSGIRGFRHFEEGDDLHLCDPNPYAADAIRKGLEYNNIEATVHEQNSNEVMSKWRNYFHVIDVDPFGSYNNFLDSAARSANHESLVMFTATDNASVAGTYPKVCRRRYASKPLRCSIKHEIGLRIYIKNIFENFARYDKDFDPKITWHEQHYTRVIGRVTESKKRVNRALDKVGHLSFCRNCQWRDFSRTEKCPECSEETQEAGPLWTGKIADRRFTEKMLENTPEEWQEARDIIELVDSEAEIITPFYDLHDLASAMNISAPKNEKVFQAIEEKGYPISKTHFSPTGFRTDAPLNDVKEIIREVK